MTKFKKVGLSALTGTLVTLSAAQAGGVTVSGTMEMSWVNLPEHKVTGNQLGQKKNISFSGSGEFSNGWTYGIFHSLNDTFTGQSSSSMNINMGGIVTIAYDSGTGGYGANAVDNIIPTAWEEVDYGFGTGLTDVGAVTKSQGVVNLTLKAPGVGSMLSLSYVPRIGQSAVADGGTAGADSTGGHHGIDAVLDLWNINTKWVSLRTGFAAEKISNKDNCRDRMSSAYKLNAVASCSGHKGDAYAGTIYQTFGLGPLSGGFQAMYKDPGTAGGIENNQAWVWGLAWTIGNYISVSYQKGWDEYYYSDIHSGDAMGEKDRNDAVANVQVGERVHASFRGVSIAGNWGPLALKGVVNRVDNQGGTHRQDDGSEEYREINLSMAF